MQFIDDGDRNAGFRAVLLHLHRQDTSDQRQERSGILLRLLNDIRSAPGISERPRIRSFNVPVNLLGVPAFRPPVFRPFAMYLALF